MILTEDNHKIVLACEMVGPTGTQWFNLHKFLASLELAYQHDKVVENLPKTMVLDDKISLAGVVFATFLLRGHELGAIAMFALADILLQKLPKEICETGR